jgi:hypothetical protein
MLICIVADPNGREPTRSTPNKEARMTDNKFAVEEATIDDVHAAFATGVLTATGLVSTYLARIQDIDKSGPTLNTFNQSERAQGC